MKINLSGKRALVGGASKGIGAAVARELAGAGASVTLIARDKETLKSIVDTLPGGAERGHGYIAADLYDLEDYKEKIHRYNESYPTDILFNNTPGPKPGSALEMQLEDFQKAYSLLFESVCFTTMTLLPGMQERGYGRIINATSVTVREPKRELVLSNTIRASIITWAKSLAEEVGAQGITVNNLLTGYFRTDRLLEVSRKKAEIYNLTEEEVLQNLGKENALKRIGSPEEFAYLVTFLASPLAGYITGTSIPVDGGYLRSI